MPVVLVLVRTVTEVLRPHRDVSSEVIDQLSSISPPLPPSPEHLVVEELSLCSGPVISELRDHGVEGSEGVSTEQESGAFSSRETKVSPEEICSGDSVTVRVGMSLSPLSLPALQSWLRLAVRSACEELYWLLELNLTVRLVLSDVSTTQSGL